MILQKNDIILYNSAKHVEKALSFKYDNGRLTIATKFSIDEFIYKCSFVTYDKYQSDKNKEYILWRLFENYVILFDPETQYISGEYFSKDHYEQIGCFIDHDRKMLNYRICKNGSSMISDAFIGRMFGEKSDKFITLDSFKQQNLNQADYRKFIVLRDPIERFQSLIAMCIRNNYIKGIIGNRKNINSIFTQMTSRIKFILHNPIFNDDPHIMPQSNILCKIQNSGFFIDEYIDISNLRSYLKTNFNYANEIKCKVGLNTHFKLTDEQRYELKIIFKDEYFTLSNCFKRY